MLNIISYQGNANQTTMRYYFSTTRMAVIKKWAITSGGENVEKLEPSYIAGGNVK